MEQVSFDEHESGKCMETSLLIQTEGFTILNKMPTFKAHVHEHELTKSNLAESRAP